MDLDLRDLRYFETIAELQHLGKAAELLHRSQPALTNCLRRLEEVCGTPLFERQGRGMRLTHAGQSLLHWAQRIRLDTEDARRQVRSIGEGVSGHIRIGIVPTAALSYLPRVVRQLWEEAPDVTLRTVVGLSDLLEASLRAGDIDLMVTSEIPVDESCESIVLYEDHYVVAASSTHELMKKRPTLKDLTSYRWALQAPGLPTRDWLDHTFDRYRLPRPKVQVESTMVSMLPALIEQTGLLTFVSQQNLAGNHYGALKEIPLKEATMSRRVTAAWRRDAYVSKAAERMIELLKTAIDHEERLA